MIEPRYAVLHALFADRLLRVPPYQRYYSWGKRQRQDLFSDLMALATRAADQHHFMATLVCHRTPESVTAGTGQFRIFDIVDGQQRLTTLIILLKSIELALPPDDDDRKELAKLLVKRDGHLVLIQTNNPNEAIFDRFLREGARPDKTQLHTRADRELRDAIDDCSNFVRRWQLDQRLGELIRMVLHRLGFVVFDMEDGRMVYSIFEVLNSRGLAVDWLDKTKSVLMGRAAELQASPEEEVRELQTIWGDIYREIGKTEGNPDEVLRVTATLKYGTGAGRPLAPDDALEALRKSCDAPSKPRRVSTQLLEVAGKLTTLQGIVGQSPIGDVLHARVLAVAFLSGNFSQKERNKLMDQWERMTFRIFGLLNNDSRTKVGDYVRLAIQIANGEPELTSVKQVLAAMRALAGEHTIEQAVTTGMAGKERLQGSADICRYVLWQYELHLARQKDAAPSEQDRQAVWGKPAIASLDSILPPPAEGSEMSQQEREDRIHLVGRIGNLVLVLKPISEEERMQPFADKKIVYDRSDLYMLREVCAEAEWGLTQIEQREAKILEWVKERWGDL